MSSRSSSRSRTFSIPAGTILPDGTRVARDYRVTIEHAGSPGAAQKAARRQVAEQVRADYPGSDFTLSQLQASTAKVNRSTGRARGGRNPRFSTKERYEGKVENHEIPAPKRPTPGNWVKAIGRVLQRVARTGRPHYFGLAAFGKPNPRGHYGANAAKQWVQTQSFRSVDEFYSLAPNGAALLDWLDLANIEQATIVQVFPAPAE